MIIDKELQELIDKNAWNWISAYQKLSENFIREFQHKINLDDLFLNKNLKLTDSFRKELELLIKIENI